MLKTHPWIPPVCPRLQRGRRAAGRLWGSQFGPFISPLGEGAPASAREEARPALFPLQVPDAMVRRCTLRNFASEAGAGFLFGRGGRAAYQEQVARERERRQSVPLDRLPPDSLHRLSLYCSVPQAGGYPGRGDVAATLLGQSGKLLRTYFAKVPQTPLGYAQQRRRLIGYSAKLARVADDVCALQAPGGDLPKVLIMIHRSAGYKVLLAPLSASCCR